MAFNDTKNLDDVISASDWNDFVDYTELISGSYFPHSSNSLIHYPSSNLVPWLLSSNASVNALRDVDTSSDSPERDEVLKWNGTNWVPAAYNTTFVFSIASFSDGESTTQLIGTGVWEADSNMTYSATYNNGPPDGAWVQMSINGAGYNKVGSMTGPGYTAGTNDEGAINYPASKDQYLRFRLSAQAGTDTDTELESSIYFRNYIRWGVLNKNSGFTAADISGLSNKTISNDHTTSVSLNAGGGQYLVFAHPASYSDLPTGDDYEDDSGGTGFRFNGMTAAFETKEIVSITNSAGYTENYEAYGSTLANLGNSTLTTYTSRQELNEIYYGVTSKSSGYTETDVEGLANSPITDDSTQTWSEVTAGVGEYLLFCFPKRWGEKGTAYTFYDNGTGFEASFEDAETVSVTNSQGWTEDFYVYRSENANLGAITIRTS